MNQKIKIYLTDFWYFTNVFMGLVFFIRSENAFLSVLGVMMFSYGFERVLKKTIKIVNESKMISNDKEIQSLEDLKRQNIAFIKAVRGLEDTSPVTNKCVIKRFYSINQQIEYIQENLKK